MAGNIKGITIEFNGEDKGLKSVMNHLRNEARAFDKELRQIDNSLKFNPNNPTLLAQKMKVLKDAADDSEKRVKALKDAQAQLDGKNVDKNSQEYRQLQREILKAENQQANYNKELKKMEDAMSPLGQASKKMGEVGNKATQAGEALKGLSTAAAGIDVALAGLAYKSGRAADDLNTLSKVTGISTDELQKYKATADLVDVSVESIAKSQTKLKKSMSTAADGFDTLTVAEDGTIEGGNKMAKAFEKLGVSVTNANGELRGQDEVFQETIEALGKMTNETERDALAQQIFGKSAAELNPLIEDNGETYKRVADIFANNGLEIVDQETIDQANSFNDSLDEIKLTWSAALSSIGMQLAGYLAPAMEKVSQVIQSIAGWLSKLSPQTLTIIGIIAGVVAGLAPVLIIAGKLAFAISSIMSLMTTLGPILTGLAGPIGIVIAIVGALIAVGVLLYKNWDTIKAKALELKDWVVKKWNELKNSVIKTVTNLKNYVMFYWTALKLGIQIILNTLKTIVTNIWNGIKSVVTGIVTSIKNTVVSVWDAIKSTVIGIATSIRDAVVGAWDSLKNGVANSFTKVKETVTGIATSVYDWVTQKWTSLKDSVIGAFETIKSTASTVWEGIKTAITNPIQSAVDFISGAIDRIKGFFSGLSLELPYIKLPHFSLQGSFSLMPPSVPKISIDWWKTGGIFTKPTLLGGMNGVGEAGAEAVLPLKKLWEEMDKRFSQDGITINVYGTQGMDVNELAAAVEARLIATQKRRRLAW